MIEALFIIALFAFLSFLCWKFITVEWAKWLGAGCFGLIAVYKLVLFTLANLNGF